MRITSFFLSFVLLPWVAFAVHDTQTVKISDQLYMLVSPMGGNVLVSSGEDGTFIVDDQLSVNNEAMAQTIQSLTKQEVRFILNTHYHFDHTGGNEAFGGKGAIIVAHDNVRKRLSSKQFITYFKKDMAPLSKEGLPLVTFGEDVTLHYNGDAIRMRHVAAAHTDGDAFAHFTKANVIATGDVVFNGMYPFIDTEHGGSIKGMIAAQDTILELADDKTVIVPGHGALMTKTDLLTYRTMLATILQRIEKAVADGKSLEQTIAMKPTKEFDATYGGGIVPADALVKVVYADVKG